MADADLTTFLPIVAVIPVGAWRPLLEAARPLREQIEAGKFPDLAEKMRAAGWTVEALTAGIIIGQALDVEAVGGTEAG